jgi:TPR repeat protein
MKIRQFEWMGAVIILMFGFVACGDTHAELFRQVSELAEKGDAQAQYNLGMMLNNGIGTAKNPSLALQWFEKSAQAGDPLAAYKAGCYYSGQFKDTVAVDSEKSLQYKLVAAEAGYSLAQHDVANVYAQRNQFSNAIKWWEAAAKQGYPLSLYNLSVTYKEGKFVPRDNVRAYAYFKLAKVISEEKISEKAQTSLDEVKRSMTQTEFEQAEKMVSTWKAEPSALTQRAQSGLNEARQLVSAK